MRYQKIGGRAFLQHTKSAGFWALSAFSTRAQSGATRNLDANGSGNFRKPAAARRESEDIVIKREDGQRENQGETESEAELLHPLTQRATADGLDEEIEQMSAIEHGHRQ